MTKTLTLASAALLLLSPLATSPIARQQASRPAPQAEADEHEQQQTTPAPPPAPTFRALFEAGKDREVVAAVAAARQQGTVAPADTYLAGLSYERLRQPAQAKQMYQQLATRPETDPWRFIGQSAAHLADRRVDPALQAAQRAVTLAGTLPQAHYQLGLAWGHKQDFTQAAESFSQATTLDPAYAYAHYHAGLSFYRVKRVDLMTRHFEEFVRLAPQAPERGQVESILRTVRGEVP